MCVQKSEVIEVEHVDGHIQMNFVMLAVMLRGIWVNRIRSRCVLEVLFYFSHFIISVQLTHNRLNRLLSEIFFIMKVYIHFNELLRRYLKLSGMFKWLQSGSSFDLEKKDGVT